MGRGTMPVLLAACAAAIGCTESGRIGGELGNGSFDYRCVGATDAFCETPFVQGRRAPTVALDAPFTLEYVGGSGSGLWLESASPVRLAPSRGRFAFLQEGPAAILAIDTAGVVHDFAHLEAVQVADLELVAPDRAQLRGTPPNQQLTGDPWALQPVEAVVLPAGAHLLLFGYPLDAFGEVPAGAVPWGFSVQPPELAALHGALGDNVTTVEALAPGSGILRVRAGDAVREIPLHVEVGP